MPSSPDVSETKTTSAPWKEQKPYIIQGLKDASTLYGQGAPAYYPGATYAGLTGGQAQNVGNIYEAAKGPYLSQAAGTLGGVAQSGGSPGLAAAGRGYGAIGAGGGPGSDATQGALSAYQQAAQQGGIGGAGGLNTLRQASRGDLIGQNPYLDAIYNRGAGDIQSRLQGMASAAGRTNSGALGHQVTQDLGDFNNQLYGGAYAQERANQLGAAQTLQQQAFQGLAGAAGQGAQQTGAALAGLGGQAATGQQQTGNQLTAAQGLSGMDAARIANQQAALQAGGLRQQDTQNQINANIQRYNYNANAPMNWLQQYMGTVGAGYGGGTQTTQTPYYQPSPWATAAGIGTGIAGLFL